MTKKSTICCALIATAGALFCPSALAVEKTVSVSKAGTLSTLIPASEKNTVTSLTVSGTLNGNDVLYIREMAGQDVEGNATNGTLTELNLESVTLTDGGDAYYKDSWSSYYTATSYDVNDDEDEYYCTDLSYAFTGTNLIKVVWPGTMWEVGTDALSYCTGLTSFTLGASTNEIKNRAFYGCTSLAGIDLTEKILYVDDYAFAGCTSLKSIALPSEIETVYRNTFDGCKALESVTLGGNVTDIRTKAFSGCTALKSIVLPDALTQLGDNAFDGCTSLASITLPKKLRSIGTAVFDGCTSLGSIDVATGNSYYASVDGVLFNKAMTVLKVCPVGKIGLYAVPEGTEEIEESAFGRCAALTAVTLPSTLTSIGDEAFYRCTGIGSLVIPNSVTSVGQNAFYRCAGLESVTLGSGMTQIGESMFYYCTGLEDMVIPEGYTALGYEAFAGCSALKSVDIPSTVTAIGAEVFSGCSSLEKVTARMASPVAISADVFEDVDVALCRLCVPESSVSLYKADAQWGKFTNISPISATGVGGINDGAAKVIVSVSGGVLRVAGNDAVSVYTSAGRLVCEGASHSVTLPGRGVYVIVTGGATAKVVY